jgi:hypothetical protein
VTTPPGDFFSRNKSTVVGHKWWAVTSGAEMKQPLLGAMAGLAFVGLSLTAHAVPFDFTYTGSLVTFTVPTTDTYQILAFGAQGGNITRTGTGGGLGAEIGGDFILAAGEILQIARRRRRHARRGGRVEASSSALVTHRWSLPAAVAVPG